MIKKLSFSILNGGMQYNLTVKQHLLKREEREEGASFSCFLRMKEGKLCFKNISVYVRLLGN